MRELGSGWGSWGGADRKWSTESEVDGFRDLPELHVVFVTLTLSLVLRFLVA